MQQNSSLFLILIIAFRLNHLFCGRFTLYVGNKCEVKPKKGAHEKATVNQIVFTFKSKKKGVLDGSINLLASAV